MSHVETLFLLVPQVFTVRLIYRYRQEALLDKSFIFFHISSADIRCAYLFSIKEILSDDWEVLDRHEDGSYLALSDKVASVSIDAEKTTQETDSNENHDYSAGSHRPK